MAKSRPYAMPFPTSPRPAVQAVEAAQREGFPITGPDDLLAAVIYVAGEVPAARPDVLAAATAMTFEAFTALEGAGAGSRRRVAGSPKNTCSGTTPTGTARSVWSRS